MITSYKNPRIKTVRDLLDSKKQRDTHQQMILEGVRLAEEAVRHQVQIQQCFFSANLSDRGKAVVKQINSDQVEIEEIPADLMDRLSDTQHAQGILLVCATPRTTFPQHPSYILALDRINDPGNMGTILRTAAALQFDGILLTPGTTDPFSPKALRAAMGTQLYLPIQWKEAQEIKAFCEAATTPLELTASVMDCPHTSWDMDLSGPLCLVIGNEAAGISKALLGLSDRCVKIPIAEETESFNAAVAAAILMYEIKRQRKQP